MFRYYLTSLLELQPEQPYQDISDADQEVFSQFPSLHRVFPEFPLRCLRPTVLAYLQMK